MKNGSLTMLEWGLLLMVSTVLALCGVAFAGCSDPGAMVADDEEARGVIIVCRPGEPDCVTSAPDAGESLVTPLPPPPDQPGDPGGGGTEGPRETYEGCLKKCDDRLSGCVHDCLDACRQGLDPGLCAYCAPRCERSRIYCRDRCEDVYGGPDHPHPEFRGYWGLR